MCFFVCLFFYWNFVALQCCLSFHCTSEWISCSPERWVEFPMQYSRFSLVIYFIHSCVYVSIPISQFIPPLLSPLGIHVLVLYFYVFMFDLQIGSSAPKFTLTFSELTLWAVLEERKGEMTLDDPSVGRGKRNDFDGKMESQQLSRPCRSVAEEEQG